MSEGDDHILLARYASEGSESAFATLVSRHLNLVYGAGLRLTGDAEHARDITQAVFILLARKAGRLGTGTVIAGWLYRTARLTAANLLRGERRRRAREAEAGLLADPAHGPPPREGGDPFPQLLEAALGRLGRADQEIIVRHFLEAQSISNLAGALRITEGAARKRLARALDKLRRGLRKHGRELSVAVVAAALADLHATTIPAGLGSTVLADTTGAAAMGTVAELVVMALRASAWIRLKVTAGAVAGTTAIVVAAAAAGWSPERVLAGGRGLQNAKPAAAARATPVPAPSAGNPEAPRAETLSATTVMTLDTPPGGLAIQPDGKILVGASLGGFYLDPQTGRLGQFRRGALRLNPDGSLDSGFCSRAEFSASDASRAQITTLPDGRLLLSGLFDRVEGEARPGYAVLGSDGRLAAGFVPWRGSTNQPQRTYLPGGVYPAAALTDGSVAVLNGAVEGRMAPFPLSVYRLGPTGERLPPDPAPRVTPGITRPSGLVLALGPIGFWTRKPIDWGRTTPARRHPLAFPPGTDHPVTDIPFDAWDEPPSAADAAPVLAALFDEAPMELCRYAVRQPDQGTVLAVRTRATDGKMSGEGSLMRFDAAWHPVAGFTNWYEADVRSSLTLKAQADGRLLLAGLVGRLQGSPFPGVVRLDADGTIDRSFHCETGAGWENRVMDVAPQPDGRIVIAGFFDTVNGVRCPHLARLNPDGSLDQTFRPPFRSWAELNAVRFPVHQGMVAAETETEAETPAPGTAPGGKGGETLETIAITSIRVSDGTSLIRFSGRPRGTYVLQAQDSLGGAGWQNVCTNRTDANGTGLFQDPGVGQHPSRFYRVALP